VINVLRPRQQDSLVIFGLGAVGFAALFAASYLNLDKIIVVDLVPSRLELARELGAHHALNGSSPDLVEQIRMLTKGGANYSIEATGVVPVLRNAFECLCYSGTVVSLGNPGPGVASPFEIHDMVNTGKAWRGCVEGDSNPPHFIPFLIELVLPRARGHLIDSLTLSFSLDCTRRGSSRWTGCVRSSQSKNGMQQSHRCECTRLLNDLAADCLPLYVKEKRRGDQAYHHFLESRLKSCRNAKELISTTSLPPLFSVEQSSVLLFQRILPFPSRTT